MTLRGFVVILDTVDSYRWLGHKNLTPKIEERRVRLKALCMEVSVALLTVMAVIVLTIVLILIVDQIKSHRAKTQLSTQLIQSQAALKHTRIELAKLQQTVTELNTKAKEGMYDSVTNILGWRLFEDRLKQNIKESLRYQLTLGVLFVDLDEFKVVNDALGYQVGDALLTQAAARLQTCIRQVDSVSRFNKDTFVVLLMQLNKAETATVVVQRIMQSLAQPFQIENHELYMTACVGIAIYPTDGQNAEALLRGADEALHLAKAKGKHHYQFYQADLHEKGQRELTLYNNLSREAFFQELVLYFQPIMNVHDNKIICLDVLLHWQQPQYGLILPNEVMSLAERQRKLNVISGWLLKKACQQFQHWHAFGFQPDLLGISLSITQLESVQFIYDLSHILQELQFDAGRILFQIKERMMESKLNKLEKSFNMLHYIGVKIAIDDFGCGLFSLQHLKHFPIHFLKLDSSLVAGVEDQIKTIELIKSIVFLAQHMSMQLIVKNVDHQEQIGLLTALGCSLMQGSAIFAPIKEDEVKGQMASL